MNTKTAHILKKLGVPPHIKGYKYIIAAVDLILEDEKHLYGVTKTLYPAIARKFETTSSRVERAIRHAVETAFDTMPLSLVEDVFGNTINPARCKPTNSHFLATMLELVRDEA